MNLWVVPAHNLCNEDYRKDEEYFYYAMCGVVQTSNITMGQVMLRDLFRRRHKPQTPAMIRAILKTFRTVTEGGIHLPPNVVQFSIDQYRSERVVIKIAQGLLYRDLKQYMPRENCKDIRFCRSEHDVPELYSLSWQGAERVAVLPDVFAYRRMEFDGLQLMSILFWESLMFCCAFENIGAQALACAAT